MSLKRWIDDRRWALLMRRIRIERRHMTWQEQITFDEDLRPRLTDEDGYTIYYPASFYEITKDDYTIAKKWKFIL